MCPPKVSHSEDHRLLLEDADENSDEVNNPLTCHKNFMNVVHVVQTFLSSFSKFSDSISQKVEVDCLRGAFWRGGQSSSGQCTSRENSLITWKSPARDPAVQKATCYTHIPRCSGLVVGETVHSASPVWALKLIPLCASIVYPPGESFFNSRRHTQPREVTHSTWKCWYAHFSTQKQLKQTPQNVLPGKNANSCFNIEHE